MEEKNISPLEGRINNTSRVKCLKSDKSIVGQLLHSCKDNVNYSMKYVIKCNYIEPWQESCYKTSQWYQFLPSQ